MGPGGPRVVPPGTGGVVIGWPRQLGQGCRPWRRLRLWHVSTIIARVAEIGFVVSLWISMIVGWFLIIKYRLQCSIAVAVTSRYAMHHLRCCVCFWFPSPCKYGYNKAAVEVQCCMQPQLACRAQRQGHEGPCSAPAVKRTQNQVRVERCASVQG